MRMKDLCSATTALILGCLVASNTMVSKTKRVTRLSGQVVTVQDPDSVNQQKSSVQSREFNEIRQTLVDYIEGSTGGQPKRLQRAFHSGLNLYSVRDSKLRIWSGQDYISSTKEGQPTGETGKILSIDFENDIAVAKVEIAPPRGAKFIDYFMLVKIENRWTIVHKMFTRANGNKGIWPRNSLPTDAQGSKPKKDASQQENERRNSNATADLEQALDATVNKILQEQHVPGLAVVVVEQGKTVVSKGYGLANIAESAPVDPNKTLFRIGSISKALTFLALTRLIDDGRIGREDSVEKFVGPIPNPRKLRNPITVDHLLTHTGGFDQIGTKRHIYDQHLSLAARKAKRPDIVSFLKSDNLRRVTEPGQLFRYDTYGTTLAGAILEKVTGLPYAEAMKQELFDRVGMNDTMVEADERLLPRLAIGYGWNDGAYQAQPYEVYVTTPASSIDATPADMGSLLEALTGGGKNASGTLFTKDTMKRVLAPQFREHPEFVGMTHGLFESYTSYEGDSAVHLRTVGHGGSMAGYRSALTIIPEKQLGIFVTANRAPEVGGGPIDFRPIVAAIVKRYEDSSRKPNHAVPNPSTTDLAEFAGDFYYGVFCQTATAKDVSNGAWPRRQPRGVAIEDGLLVIGSEKFIPRGDDVFVQEDGSRLVFFGRDSNNKISHFVYSTSPDTFEKESTRYPYREFNSLAQRIFELARDGDVDSAVEFFHQHHQSPDYYTREQELNNAGYALMRAGRMEAAIRLFKLNVGAFPDSWNVYDSLAEAYAESGETELAIANYEKAVKLNPQNEAGRKRLATLKEQE